MNLALIASVLLFFIIPASALIPADNILDNKSYVAENNTNTSFIPENREVFVPEETTTPILTSTPTSIPISSSPSITPTATATSISSSSSSSSSGGGSSGGGGGGGGISSSENFSNVIQFEQQTYNPPSYYLTPKQSPGFGAGLVLVAFLIVVAFRKHR